MGPLEFHPVSHPAPDLLERLSGSPIRLPLTPDHLCGRCGRLLIQPRARGKFILHRCWPADPRAAGTADHEDGLT